MQLKKTLILLAVGIHLLPVFAAWVCLAYDLTGVFIISVAMGVCCVAGHLWSLDWALKAMSAGRTLPSPPSEPKPLTLEDEVWLELTDAYQNRDAIADRLIARGVVVTDTKLWRVLTDMVDRYQVERDFLGGYRLRLKGGRFDSDATQKQ